ncbi:MAG: sugar ABC transporter ATP-binding protein [Clostridiales bacterium]|nr:sugar ABC transporter ATP-binding protein [Clostridiales bacterium]
MGYMLEMKGIQKYFPGVHALDDCQFDLKAGEVHALIGENGAGKSTLMKILSGVYMKDGGTVLLDGREINVKNTLEAQQLGISIIHQEINLMQDLTVSENIYIGREPMRGFVINKAEQDKRTEALLKSLHLNDIQPSTKVRTLTVAKQQMVEIAKALSFESTRILIMDEPTAALTESEIQDLFKFIHMLKAKGVGIIYISHRMEELKIISDRVTVMRDGQYVGTRDTAVTELQEIISMMVGRTIYEEPKSKSMVPDDAPVVLEVKNLCSPAVKDVSFKLRKGEILGLSGLMGAGRTETARLICGADPRTSGEIFVDGKLVHIKTPNDAVKAGIGYLSEDRKRFGLCLGLSVSDNVALPNLETHTRGAVVNDSKIVDTTRKYVDKIRIKTPTVKTLARSLSGGNQQKVVLAKWLERDCDILIFVEPTRGIDVGAKSEIYKLMNDLVQQGKSIIMISSEMPELLRMSDRIVVMCEGVKTGELSIEEATQEKIMTLATKLM